MKDDFEKYLEEKLKDPEFKKEYDKLEYEYFLIEIKKRIEAFLKSKAKIVSKKKARKKLGWDKKKTWSHNLRFQVDSM